MAKFDGYLLPQVCIYCKRFPCMKRDKEATVVCEIDATGYTIVDEDDALKPCGGERFSPVQAVVKEVVSEKAPEIEALALAQDHLVYAIEVSNAIELQKKIDVVTQSPQVSDYKVAGLSTIYDSESAKTKILCVLEVWQDKEEKFSEPVIKNP